MRLSKAEIQALQVEFGTAFLTGGVAAFFVPASALARIDEMLVTFFSIVLAAVIPGVALTAGAARPAAEGPLEARKLGADLETQVRFWFGFLLVGGVSVGVILLSSALEWRLSTPRPAFTPEWVPDGSAWLVFASITSIAFTILRVRHVANAIIDLVRLGTDAHAAQAAEARKRIQAEVEEALKKPFGPPERGASAGERERVPRSPPN